MRHPLHGYAVIFVEFTYFVQIFAVRGRLYPVVEEDHQQHQYDQLNGAQLPVMMRDQAPVGPPPHANQQRVRQRKGGAPPRRKESSSHSPFVQPAVPGPFAAFANDPQQPSGHVPLQQQFHQQQQQGLPTNYAHLPQAEQNAHHLNQYYPQIQNNNAPLLYANNGTGAPPPQPPYRHSSPQYAQQPQQQFIGGRRHGTAPPAVPSPANPMVPPNYVQQNVAAAALAAPLADLLLPEPVPDLLTDSVPSVFHRQQTEHPPVVDSSVPLAKVNSLMDQMSIVPMEEQQNLFGTMEVYYTELEQKKMGHNGKEQKIVWEIYRQRDNTKKFVKFRHVNKRSGDTEFSCVAPLPGKGLTKLFFNNNPNLAFSFDASGYMLGKAGNFE
uniref:Velvet domain-containing protein n=1 Tax=Globodera pallida TaxID=36090 RepID=A0A183CNH7_GLOPA